ncbi:hypothetical protein HHL11_00200 [Ramlibacter sp. G-1-2-2]|uniref:Porin n=1 Tax=Ramlibacter agri TaxID=2728837 RepID=A0A848GVK1_9BURK|nr:hypothetical protein [Ramlibacter agri]NML42147.1 hypothetical protein [Ramlibacter agri]
MVCSRSSRLPLRIVAAAVIQLFAVSAYAADEAKRIEELEKKLAASMELIEKLSARVNQLEAGRPPAPASATAAAPAPAPASASAEQAARIDRLEQSVLSMSESTAKTHDLGIPLHGFADVGYAHSSLPVDGRKGGFTLGNLDLYMTPQISDRVRALVELVFEYGPQDVGVSTDLERLQFGYTFSDSFTLWAGRYHTPYGYWNAAFHHGQQIQTSATRPRFIDFEDRGGILPAHGVGLLGSGSVRSGGGRLLYDAYVANGDRIIDNTLDLNAAADDNGNKLVGGNIRYAFGGNLDGLMLGLHAFSQKVSAYDTSGIATSTTQVNMFGGLAVYDTDRWEIISEYYRFRDKDLSGGTGTHGSWAGFVQAGYHVGPWTPYARWEKTALDQSDNYFAAQDSGRSYLGGVLGLRYNLDANSAIKLELNQFREELASGPQRSHGGRVQFAVRF